MKVSELSVLPAGLLAMLKCAFVPWRAPDVFRAHEKAVDQGCAKAFMLSGLAMFFVAGVLRNVAFEGNGVMSVVIMMAVAVIIPMLVSYPGALVLAGVSAGADLLLLTLSLIGLGLPSWFDGAWELTALVVAYFSVWRFTRARPIAS